ncbi:MAG: cell division protein FtsA [Opitutaceae bacterium]|nr:cell division protein FtsA [Opitutaceae bacterium]
MYRSKIIAGIEIGTSKVSVLLGEIAEGRSLNIIGLGQSSSKGVLKGDIVDFHEASDCTHAAILSAEEQAGVKIDGVYLAVSGSDIEGFASEASVNVTAGNHRVTKEEIEQVSGLAKTREIPEDRVVVHHLRRPYRLDSRPVEAPLNMEGDRLEANYWTVHGNARKIGDAIHIINGFNLHVDDVVLGALAAGSIVATEEEKRNGCLVVDIGRGSTDYAVFQGGRCVLAGCLPLGGDHISNDLSIGLRMRLKQAESLKRRYGSATVEHKNKSEKVWLNNDFEIGDRPVPLWSVEKIIELRTTEIFQVVQKKLGAHGRSERLSGGVILSGGTSNLRNIEACSEAVFGASTRVGDNTALATGDLRDAQYSVVIGLLKYGLQYHSAGDEKEDARAGLFGKLRRALSIG